MKTSGGLAIFVKTPGLSSVKTRLAASIGREKAEEFYRLSVESTKEVVSGVNKLFPGLQVYWAIAEKAGLDSQLWTDFSRIWQGDGGLGDRLHSVYKDLLEKHHFVCFIGADSPHLLSSDLGGAIELTAKKFDKKFVVGPTEDGGFYFFGGSRPVSKDLWCSVEYSSHKTLSQLENKLISLAGIEFLKKAFDVDNKDDLDKLIHSLEGNEKLINSKQKELFDWVAKNNCANFKEFRGQ